VSVCVCGHYFQQTGHQPGMVANSARGQLNRRNNFFLLSPFAPESLVSRVRLGLLILHTQAESGAYVWDFTPPPRFPLRLPLEPSCAIGIVPSLSGDAYCVTDDLPRTGTGASNSQGTSINGRPMEQFMHLVQGKGTPRLFEHFYRDAL